MKISPKIYTTFQIIIFKLVRALTRTKLVFVLKQCTDKNREKIMRKIQKIVPNFLKMRILLSKLANNSPILTKIFSF